MKSCCYIEVVYGYRDLFVVDWLCRCWCPSGMGSVPQWLYSTPCVCTRPENTMLVCLAGSVSNKTLVPFIDSHGNPMKGHVSRLLGLSSVKYV